MEEDEEQISSAEAEHENPTCPMCGGSDLYYGYIRHQFHSSPGDLHVFLPRNKLTFGYYAGTFVCLNCGYLGQFIYRSDLEKLRTWVKKRREKEARKRDEAR